MSQRTRRASEAVEIHYDFMDGCRMGSDKDVIESPLLDVTRDPYDVRYGHGDFMYGEGQTFQDWLKRIVNEARTFTATTDLWREVMLTLDMLVEEGIDWLPLQPQHVPADSGFIIFPYGVKVPHHIDNGMGERRNLDGTTAYWDEGGGTEWWIDGFIWTINNKVAADGVAGPPSDGITLIPLTRYRDDDNHRPFRLSAKLNPSRRPPRWVASDLTGWAFDKDGQFEWGELAPESAGQNALAFGAGADDPEGYIADLVHHRDWLRMLVWATFRWLTEEVWIPEVPDRPKLIKKMKRARPVIHENTMEDGEIVIVDLRLERKEAVAKGDAGGEPPWWRTRWIVRGHYAKRRFAIRDEHGNAVGPVRGEGAVEGETFYYKKVKIEPFIKGPDSAPLVLRDRVGVLTR